MTYTKTKDALNQLVADLSQASAAIHQIHWYLRGNNFMSLHEKMDEYRDEVEEQLDEIAERLITLDGAPYSTLEEFAEHTKIESRNVNFDIEKKDHLSYLVDIFRTLVASYDQLIADAQDEGDCVSEDMAIGYKGDIEKNIWFLQAELGLAPGIDA